MITAAELTTRITAAFPDAVIELNDLTGGLDHWQALIVSSAFEGLSPIARHRKVYAALAEEMKGPIHALTLTTLTPNEPRPAGR
jgi:stress-induced morphogen